MTSYVDPATIHVPATNTIAPAAWGAAVNAAIEWVANDKPRCRVYKLSQQSVPNNANTALLFDAEYRDVNAMHSTVSNTSRITVPAGGAGDYLISFSGCWAANATGYRDFTLLLNGTDQIADVNVVGTASVNQALTVTASNVPLIAGDYVEVQAFQNSGGALNVLALSKTSPVFSATWMGT